MRSSGRRCLIPADGYYEWHVAGNRKRPYFIYHPPEPPAVRPCRFGGKPGSARNGEEVDTVAIVTAPASPDLAVLHPRVPVTIAAG